MVRTIWCLLVCACLAAADESDRKRIAELEQDNRELEERVRKIESNDLLRAEVNDYLDGQSEDEGEGLGLNLVIKNGDVRATFQLFGDSGLRYDNPEVTDRSNTFFFNGSFDFFFTARVGDHFQVLTETVFLTSSGGKSDGSRFDQERLWAAWLFSDSLQIKFGLEHGSIARWNQQFHHGRWLEPTINRPYLARFEAGGGILPMHNAGVEITGVIQARHGLLNYIIFLSNGRGNKPTKTQEFSDRNDGKAFDLGLGYRPDSVPELWIGFVYRIDDIPADFDDPRRQQSIRELIASFQVDYRGERIDVLLEVVWLQNRDRQSGDDFDHYSGYVYIGYHVDDEWTPYLRMDFREMDSGDPYYEPLNRDLDAWELIFGIRYDFIENAAIKFELGFGEFERRRDGDTMSTSGLFRGGFQLAWVF